MGAGEAMAFTDVFGSNDSGSLDQVKAVDVGGSSPSYFSCWCPKSKKIPSFVCQPALLALINRYRPISKPETSDHSQDVVLTERQWNQVRQVRPVWLDLSRLQAQRLHPRQLLQVQARERVRRHQLAGQKQLDPGHLPLSLPAAKRSAESVLCVFLCWRTNRLYSSSIVIAFVTITAL